MKKYPDLPFWNEVEQWVRKNQIAAEEPMMSTRVTETDREVIAIVEIPGLREQHDLDIRVVGDGLVIRGGTESEKKRDRGGDSHLKRSEMLFFVTLPLPAPVISSRIHAELNGSILTVRIPKRKS